MNIFTANIKDYEKKKWKSLKNNEKYKSNPKLEMPETKINMSIKTNSIGRK